MSFPSPAGNKSEINIMKECSKTGAYRLSFFPQVIDPLLLLLLLFLLLSFFPFILLALLLPYFPFLLLVILFFLLFLSSSFPQTRR